MKIAQFTFNAFSENTYLLFDESLACAIIDPGMMTEHEEQILFDFISEKGLVPSMILNTHCHIDHILGNQASQLKYAIPLYYHEKDQATLDRGAAASLLWNIPYRLSPNATSFIQVENDIAFGNTSLEVRFAPGHAPGHVVFIHHPTASIIGGDVLFKNSVGRVDLPGGDAQELVKSIREQLYTLPDHYIVYPGHGETTSIGREKEFNQFVRLDETIF